MRQLAAAFDDMAARLGRLLGAQHAFVADASHQLRTPLTALRLRLENLEPVVPSDDAGNLRAAISEMARLTRLVDGLLVLARAEATTPVVREVVDAAAVAADRGAAWAPLAAENGVALTLESGPPAPVWALPGALEQVLDNLLANALRHAPAGSQAHLATRRVGGWIELHVIDQGPGMTSDQRERAFGRFWRAPGADQEGSGLGLDAVVRLRPADHTTTRTRRPTTPRPADPRL